MGKLVFKDWLVEKGILAPFVRNMMAQHPCRLERSWEHLRGVPYLWIDKAFFWRTTPEGYAFWKEKHVAWSDLLIQFKGALEDVEMGLPMNDELGMVLLSAELEEERGQA